MSGPPNMRRKDQRFEYHKDHDHVIDKCYALKDPLEDLVWDGHLTDYLPKKVMPANELTICHEPSPLGVIHMIYNIPSLNRVDTSRLTFPHDDALVIELQVNQFAIEPVFVDQGSTSKIMQDCVCWTWTLNVEFLIVKLPSSYNMIMGRTWLHAMHAVPSTYCQVLRFLTEFGIEQIRGSQKSTKDSYLTALAKKPKELEVNSMEVPDQESLEEVRNIPAEKVIEDLEWVLIPDDLEKFFLVGVILSIEKR
ncbi:uncharacterized protein LOC114302884 [Camellia sinensis]|uniref:uncharacterized protein LOC114302884 n=1 Tax=Camellia sinensis TaxID=4442 RepID=UPI001035D5D5|nr:uncharacterized protein LOC114302884 [Camellia sinensis]